MAVLYGKQFGKTALLERVGSLQQFGGARLCRLSDGSERGVRLVEVRTGSGLRFEVALDRGMDISFAEYCGRPLCWVSPTGVVAPTFYEPGRNGWLRSFFGGLLTTCGLDQVGSACEEEGEELGLHGRISNVPAHQVSYGSDWDGDDVTIWVEGRVRQVKVSGENLLLHRRISTRLGANWLRIEDRISNDGFTATPLMVLYHFNIGFPLLDDGSELWAPTLEVQPRDAAARKGVEGYARFGPPVPEFQEQVFYHRMAADPEGWVTLALAQPNAEPPWGLRLSYKQDTLPRFVQWKMMGQGLYVVGLEPANCRVEGRTAQRQRGELEWIQPGQTQPYALELEAVEGGDRLDDLRRRIEGTRDAAR